MNHANNITHSLVRVYNGNPTVDGQFIGTAFFISEQKLLTAAHVVLGCKNGVFLQGLADGSCQQIASDAIECCPKMGHWTADVAILHCPTPQPVFPIIPAQRSPQNGEDITIYGFKDTVQSLIHRDTHISGHVSVQDCWNVADGVHRGMSGGAVLREGELVGVLHARDEADKITAYFIPINVIHDWLGDSFTTLFDTSNTHLNETEQQRALDIFVGRQDELSQLKAHLSVNSGTPVAITALHGMAGVGKSWLADHFFASHKAQFPGGYFRLTLEAENPASAELLLAELAERCELSAPQQSLAKHLRIRLNAPRTLVHIENIDTPAAVKSATQLCTQLSGCPMVLSGRIENFGTAQRWKQVSLKPFQLEDGLAQLQAEVEWLGDVMPESAEAQLLVNTLGGLPLAIHLAAGYLAQGYGALEFLEELKATGYDLSPADASDDLFNRDEAKAVLNSTFRLSLKELAKQAATRKIDAADQVFANLGMASISGFGLSIAAALLELPEQRSRSLLRLAQSLSLIDLIQAEPPRWQLHPLLSAYLREQISDLPNVEVCLDRWFLKRLPEPEAQIDNNESNTEPGWQELNYESSALAEWLMTLPKELQYIAERTGSEYATRNGPFIHWMLFCEAALSNPQHDEKQRSEILFTLMQVTELSGNPDKSISYAEEKYELDIQREDHKGAALAKGQIADILKTRNQLEEALRIHVEYQLPVYQQLGELHEIAITKGKIADIILALGNTDEALRIYKEEQIPLYKQLKDVRSLAITKGRIADILQDRESLDEALHIRQHEELPIYEQLKDLRLITITKSQIADILQVRGNFEEALRIRQEDLLPIYERIQDVRSIAITKRKIADILFLNGEHAKAIGIYEESVLPVYEKVGDKRMLLVAQTNLALMYLKAGDDKKRALELLQIAYQSAEEMQIPEAGQIKGIIEQIS